MFSRISQFSKNISDEITRISDDVNNVRQQGEVAIDTVAANNILHTETPNPDTLIQPEDEPIEANTEGEADNNANVTSDESKLNGGSSVGVTTTQPSSSTNSSDIQGEPQSNKPSSASTPEPKSMSTSGVATPVSASANNSMIVPGTNINWNELSPELRSKMKKFMKYEEKYPLLLDAYKTEKKKTSYITLFENALKDSTPCDGIADIQGFKQYLSGLNSKIDILNNEFKRVVGSENSLKKVEKQLNDTVKSLNDKIKSVEKQNHELKDKLKDAKSDNGTSEETQQEVESLKKQIVSLKSDLANQEDYPDIKSQLDSAKQEVTKLNEELSSKSSNSMKNSKNNLWKLRLPTI
ncbi:unnamed protein product [[Candida] boidinii]|uniref:Unnamed protein product n=1 Tax=Candida boidinii TaxID=5477 RepID=A0A9W6SWN2_CANBO|nr:unnamed protein product [[Candida] boidinii]